MPLSKHLQILNINQEPLTKALDVDSNNLVEIYKVFIQLEMLCKQHGVSSLCANQVGVPWNMFVVCEGSRVRQILNAKYTPRDKGRQQGLVRFINAEVGRPRYYLLEFHNEIEAEYFELDYGSTLIEKKEAGTLLWFQFNVDIVNGRCPHVQGVEYLVGSGL